MSYLIVTSGVFILFWLLNFVFGSYETFVFQSLAGICLFTAAAEKFRAFDNEKEPSNRFKNDAEKPQ